LYQSCPRAWRYHYIKGLPGKGSPAASFGSDFHKVIQDWITARAEGVSFRPEVAWHNRWQQTTEKLSESWGAELPEGYALDGQTLIALPSTHSAVEYIHPLVEDERYAIERPIKMSINRVGVPITGFIDVIQETYEPIDLKTTGHPWTTKQALSETQPLFYLLALLQEGHDLPQVGDRYAFTHIVFVRGRKPQVQMFRSTYSLQQMLWLQGAIRDVWWGIQAGAFPANPSSWRCSPTYCAYWPQCRGKE